MSSTFMRLRHLGLGLVVILLLVGVVTAVTATTQPHTQTPTTPMGTFMLNNSTHLGDDLRRYRDTQFDPNTHRLYISASGQVHVLNSLTGEAVTQIDTQYLLETIQLNHDGTRLYGWAGHTTAGSIQKLYRIDTTQNQITFAVDHTNPIHSMTVGPDNNVYIIPWGFGQYMDVFDGDTGLRISSIFTNTFPAGHQLTGQLNHGNHLLLSLSYTSNVQEMTEFNLRDLTEFPPQEILSTQLPGRYQLIAYSSDGSKILAAHYFDPEMILLDAATLLPHTTIPFPEGSDTFQNLVFSLDGQSVIFQDYPHLWAYDLVSNSWSHHYERFGYDEHIIAAVENGRLATHDLENIHFYIPANHTTFLPAIQKNYCSGPVVDDFSNPASGWPVGENAYSILRYLDGQYNIYHKDGYRWMAVTRNDTWTNTSEIFRIQSSMFSGDGTFGIIFGLNSNWSDFYSMEFDVQAQRWYYLNYNDNSGWRLLDSQRIYNLLPTGFFNEIALTPSHIVVNGQTLYSPVVDLRGINGRVGLVGSSFARNTDLRFDNYLYRARECVRNNDEWETIPATLDLRLEQREALLAPYTQTP